tara:strand:- start:775 stop:1206 length:432 start_codon:yes stop_codon:yes gene_type:complete
LCLHGTCKVPVLSFGYNTVFWQTQWYPVACILYPGRAYSENVSCILCILYPLCCILNLCILHSDSHAVSCILQNIKNSENFKKSQNALKISKFSKNLKNYKKSQKFQKIVKCLKKYKKIYKISKISKISKNLKMFRKYQISTF